MATADHAELRGSGCDADVVAASVEAAAALVGSSAGRPPHLNAVKTGTRSKAIQAALVPAVDELAAAVTADQGHGESGPPVILGRAMRAWAEITAMRGLLFERMAGEPVTNKGKARAMLTAYLALLDRELRLAQVIGFERKSRNVKHLSAAEYLAREGNG
jgi:hypothetical protein